MEGVVYVPACLTDPRFAGLAEAMDAFVGAAVAGAFTVRPPLRDTNGTVIPGRETFEAVSAAILEKSIDPEALPQKGVILSHGLPRETDQGGKGLGKSRITPWMGLNPYTVQRQRFRDRPFGNHHVMNGWRGSLSRQNSA